MNLVLTIYLHILLQASRLPDVVDGAFDIDPTKIYAWALASMVILTILFGSGMIWLFTYMIKKLDTKETYYTKLIQEREKYYDAKYESLENLLESKSMVIIELKEKSLSVYRDVAQALAILELATKDTSEDLVKEISEFRREVLERITSLDSWFRSYDADKEKVK